MERAEAEIRQSWQKDLDAFKLIRKKVSDVRGLIKKSKLKRV
jgi:hypothetical protein